MDLQLREVGPGFVAEASGIDISVELSSEVIADIHAAMDRYAVLIFRDQHLTDAQQLAFTQSLGTLEQAIGTSLRRPEDHRLPTTFADVSNLDKDGNPFARDDRRRLFAIGNRLWHSDSSFKVVPAKYSLLYAHVIPSRGGNTEFADMRAAYDALDTETKDLVEDLVCEHSQLFSRSKLGFTEFTEEERERFKPVLQRLVRTHPCHWPKIPLPVVSCRQHHWMAGARGPRTAHGSHRACNTAGIRLCARMAPGRSRHVGQSLDNASRAPVPARRATRCSQNHAHG